MDKHLYNVAMGKEPADLVIKNGQIVNVYSGEIYPGGVAVAGDKIAAFGDVDYTVGDSTQVIDAEGKYITPGFLDGHIHPESSNLSPTRFAEVALCHGTTGVFTDLHEIGVVGGMEAMTAALEEGQSTPLKFHWIVPSHVPFSPGLETSGGSIDFDIIEKIQEEGLTDETEEIIQDNADELVDSIDDFDEDVQIEILENL